MPVEDEPNFKIYLDEAEYNLQASRFPEAAVTFEHIVQLCIKHGETTKAIYFCYRAIDAWSRVDNKLKMARLYQHLGKLAFNEAYLTSQEIVTHTINKKEKIEALELMAEILRVMDPEKRMFAIKDLVRLNLELSEEPDRPISERKAIVQRTISLIHEIGETELLRRVTRRLAQLHLDYGQLVMEQNGLDAEFVAAKEYETAAKLFESIGEKKTAEALRNKAKEIIGAQRKQN